MSRLKMNLPATIGLIALLAQPCTLIATPVRAATKVTGAYLMSQCQAEVSAAINSGGRAELWPPEADHLAQSERAYLEQQVSTLSLIVVMDPHGDPSEIDQIVSSRAEICMASVALRVLEGGVPSSVQRPPASSGPASNGRPPIPAAEVPAKPDTPTAEEVGALAMLDDVLALDESKPAAKPAAKTPPSGPPPELIVAENAGTRCLEAHLAYVRKTNPPEPIPDNNYWYYDIVMENRCDYPVVWYTEMINAPAPLPKSQSSGYGPFIYGGSGWPTWGQKPPPASPDYTPYETFTDVPLSPGGHKTGTDAQRVTELKPVQLWIISCPAYAADGKRSMAMFNTSSHLSDDGRFFCVPNAIPNVRY
jgi:hypothetical protein